MKRRESKELLASQMKKPSRHNLIQHDGLKLASTKDSFLYLPFLNFFIGTTRPTVGLLSFLAFTSGVDDSGAYALIFSSTASAKSLTCFADQRPLLAVERINAANACKTGLR